MAVKYQCEDCGALFDKEKDLKPIKLSIDGVEFGADFCKTCRDKLKTDPLSILRGNLGFVSTLRNEYRLAEISKSKKPERRT